ncbi:MAG: C4-type zinc ribbon domain-containing protein [Verrucomicrobiota bacterium]|jgi:predicted  nucleic acid-binding Zn-ribbon protein
MLPIIESLLVLQDRDRRLIRLRAELETVAPQRALLRGKSSQAQVALDEAKRRLTTAEGERKRLEQEAASLRQRIQKFQAEQQSTRSNDQYKLFQQQIEAAEANIRKLEDGEIELMEQVEGLTRELQAANAAATAQKKETDQQVADVDAREANLKAEVESVTAQRAQQAASMDPASVGRYERILKTRGDNVVVGVHRQTCGGCHVKLPTQIFLNAKAQVELVNCTNCGRLLYYTRDMEA